MHTDNLAAAIGHLETEVGKRFPKDRLLKHTFSVAEACRESARRLNRPDTTPEAAYLAGLAHDLYKKFSHEELRRLFLEESIPIDHHSWRLGGGLLHAPAAAHYLKSRLGIRDINIISAVYYHTTGRAGASLLERVLFCVDYMDPSRPARDAEPDIEALREQLTHSLEKLYYEIVRRKLNYTMHKQRPLHPNGVAAWNEFCSQKRRKETIT